MTFSTDILKNPEIFQINTCKPHSSHIHYRSAAECKEQQSSFFLSLNGDWKFFYSENLNALPEHFEHGELAVREIGFALMSPEKQGYLLPFEVISLLLLACIVGGILIARKR